MSLLDTFHQKHKDLEKAAAELLRSVQALETPLQAAPNRLELLKKQISEQEALLADRGRKADSVLADAQVKAKDMLTLAEKTMDAANKAKADGEALMAFAGKVKKEADDAKRLNEALAKTLADKEAALNSRIQAIEAFKASV